MVRRCCPVLCAAALVLSGSVTAAPNSGASSGPVPEHSLQMLNPGPTGQSSHNQREGASPYTVAIDDAAAEISPGRHLFRGLAKGMRNVAVVCPAGGKWFMTQPAADGSFAVDVDVPNLTGPMAVDVYAWDSGPNDPNYTVNIDARFDLFVVGPPVPKAESPPAAGMKLVWSDEFSGPLSISSSHRKESTWFSGGKPSATGSQYSDAFFVPVNDARNPFFIKDGFLRIRARHSASDASHPGPAWWSGHLSTGFPDEDASIAFRTGYAEVRMKTPLGQGAWPAFWLLDSASTLPSRDYGAVEIDVVEAYGQDQGWYMATQHRWPGAKQNEPHTYYTSKILRDLKDVDGFHTYGIKLTEAEVIWYYDAAEVYRAPLYSHDVVSPFYIMLELAMGGGWPVVAPPAGYYDLWVDYVRVYE